VALLRTAVFLQFFFSFVASTSETSQTIASLYENQDWRRFFAQTYLLRSQIKKQVLNAQRIESADMSVLVLEAMAYLRHCQFTTAEQILKGLEAVVKVEEEKEDLHLLKADIHYLKKLISAPSLRRHGRAAENKAKTTRLEASAKQDLWPVPAGQKHSLLDEKLHTLHLVVQVRNLCNPGASDNAKY
jgi:hypothetical protein